VIAGWSYVLAEIKSRGRRVVVFRGGSIMRQSTSWLSRDVYENSIVVVILDGEDPRAEIRQFPQAGSRPE
jgi:Ribonuclease G/E